jgi:hypothetical protein
MNSTNKHALRVSVVLYCKRKATPALPCWVKKLTAALYAIPECFVPFATAIRDCGRTKLGTGWQPEQRRPPLSRRGGRSSAQRRFGGERRVQEPPWEIQPRWHRHHVALLHSRAQARAAPPRYRATGRTTVTPRSSLPRPSPGPYNLFPHPHGDDRG